jgi:hypothetical protein
VKDIRPSLLFLEENQGARAVFEAIARELGASGYRVAKKLDRDPEIVRGALSTLREKQLISGSGALADSYTLFELGFEILLSSFCREKVEPPEPPCPICHQSDAMLNGVCHHTHRIG